jgi:hypothetical protein
VVTPPGQDRRRRGQPGCRPHANRFTGALLSLVICLGFASQVYAQSGWYLMTDIESGGSTTVREMLISGGKVKNLPRDEEEPWILVDLNTQEIVFVDPAQRIYARATPAAHCAALSEESAALRDLIPYRYRDDESLPPAETTDTGPAGTEAIRIREVGTTTQVGEFEVVRHDISLGRNKVEEIYLTTDARLLGQLGGTEGVAAYVALVHELNRCVREVLGEQALLLSPTGRTSLENRPEYLEMLKKGWPVKTSWLGEPSRRDETVTISSEWNVRPADLDPPASYRQVSITELLIPVAR